MFDVSVVIPTFNRWPMLAEAVASVMEQIAVDIELIIVDDGSTDETAARLPSLAEALGTAQRPLRILRTENHGPAAARNRGFAASRASLVAFLDSDDLWLTRKLERQVGYMRKNPECLAMQTEEIWIRDQVLVNPGRRHRKRNGDFFLDSLRTCLVSPSAVIMRTRAFEMLGGFDEDMRAAEDYDLWLRLLLEHPVELLAEPLVIRRAGHPGQLSATVAAIDRFRILALLKLLRCDELNGQRRDAVCDALIEKCGIYGKGSARRGNTLQADYMASLAEMGDTAWRRGPDRPLGDAVSAMRAELAQVRAPVTEPQKKANELESR